MRPIRGTDLCKSHSPGLAAFAGRRGGLQRWKHPEPEPRQVMPDDGLEPEAGAIRRDPDAGPSEIADMREMEPMSAHEVRLYIEKAVRLGVGGRLAPDLARLAVSATKPWLDAIALDEHILAIDRRLDRVNKLLGISDEGDEDDG
jgi:hypothetical protein